MVHAHVIHHRRLCPCRTAAAVGPDPLALSTPHPRAPVCVLALIAAHAGLAVASARSAPHRFDSLRAVLSAFHSVSAASRSLVSSRFHCEPSQGALAHHLRHVHVGIVDACAPNAAERLPFAVLGIDVSARGVGAARVHGRQTCRASSRASRTRKRADGSPRCAARACASGARHAGFKGQRVACRAPRVTRTRGGEAARTGFAERDPEARHRLA